MAARRLPLSTAQRLSQPVGEYFLFTLAAQLTTLALILYYFQRFSLVSLIANPLVLPAHPPVMILGGLSALAGMIFQPLGQVIAYLAWPFIVHTIRLVERFPPGQVLRSGPVAGKYRARQLRQSLNELRVPLVDSQVGQILELGYGRSCMCWRPSRAWWSRAAAP